MTNPSAVRAAESRAESAGFGLSCDPGVGQLLAVLSAAVPPNGAILELGTGAGVDMAWIVEGLHSRTDVRVVSVELDPVVAAVAAEASWPGFVQLEVGDALDVLRDAVQSYDLIFADAQAGK